LEEKDITICSPMYRSSWAQWKSLIVRDGILEGHWESADGPSKIAQIVLPWSRANDVLTELYCGSSGGHFLGM
jgi:hypothetical protein